MRCECDSHADTVVAGSNMKFLDVLDNNTPTVDVEPFAATYDKMKNIPIGTCATAYDCPDTGKTFLLLFGQALYFGNKVNTTLLCPNQMRAAGNVVEDTPCQYDDKSSHSITFIDQDDDELRLNIPMNLDGVISNFITRLPTDEEIKDETLSYFWATSEEEWNPYDTRFGERE